MATVPFWFGSNAINDTAAAAITALGSVTGTKRVLVVFWDDIKAGLTNGSTATPDSGEKWLAAMLVNAATVTSNNLAPTRKAAVTVGLTSLDSGSFHSGEDNEVFSYSTQIYQPTTIPATPDATLL
jgi:hypothetical protein